MVRLRTLLAPRYEYRILALMLVALHAAMWWDFGGPLSRSLMLAHLGLFLIWQPLWSRDARIDLTGGLIFVTAMLVFVIWYDRWLMTFWLLLLIGLVGGRVTVRRTERYAYLTTLVFLVSELLIGAIPPMFDVRSLTLEIARLFEYGLPVIAVVLYFVPVGAPDSRPRQSVDFLYGLTMALLTTILALGSLLSMYATGALYPVALFQTVLGIALFLLAISWLWMPIAGFSGLGQLWERYLQNIGTPFEHWLAALAESAENSDAPQDFLDSAADALLDLPWVAGVSMKLGDETEIRGAETIHTFHHEDREVRIDVYAHRTIGTALLLHGHLLLEVIFEFYRAKAREQELAQRAHLQAIYETGARVTHDIKNLLQSMHTMSLAVHNADGSRADGVQELMRRQLPSLTQRLQLALDKLRAPGTDAVTEAHLSEWWTALKARNATDEFEFEADLRANPLVPIDLFDSVAENLLENVRFKRQNEPGIEVSVRLRSGDGELRFSVSDNGSPVDDVMRAALFRAPVQSRSGLGIGLFQAARQADQLGFSLALDESEEGRVRFVLSRKSALPIAAAV